MGEDSSGCTVAIVNATCHLRWGSRSLLARMRFVDQQVVQELEERHPILTPTEKNWLESGRILAKIFADKGYEPKKLRDLHFDVLIAPTARSHGAKLITSNRADFELIREYREFELEVW